MIQLTFTLIAKLTYNIKILDKIKLTIRRINSQRQQQQAMQQHRAKLHFERIQDGRHSENTKWTTS